MNLRGAGRVGRTVLRDLVGGGGGRETDPSEHLEEALRWLCRAQDSTPDGGVSEGYHLYHGWLPSYPETTGYIIDTFFDYHQLTGEDRIRSRALRMAEWLLSIQNPDGSIPDSRFEENLVFDTGQVLFGLVRAFQETGADRYRSAASRAVDWLAATQGDDGTWVEHALNRLPHSYYSRVAWSLARAHAVFGWKDALDSAVRNIDWVIEQQRPNGWYDRAGFTLEGHASPYTHTIAYTIRGVLEVGLYLDEEGYLESARRAADGLLDAVPATGRVAGALDADWKGTGGYSCLTGNAQLAVALLRLFRYYGSDRYLQAARAMNRFNRQRQERSTGDPNLRGALAGSHPIWGDYIHFCYPNWAVKFFVDSLMAERAVAAPSSEETSRE